MKISTKNILYIKGGVLKDSTEKRAESIPTLDPDFMRL
jgi:hypothetical protein